MNAKTAFWKYLLAWLPMVPIAVGNGAVREIWYKVAFGELRANQISVASGCLLLGIYIWLVMARWRPKSFQYALGIGFVWVLMTVIFEFYFGHFIRGLSWAILLHDYNIFAGRLWPVVLCWVFLSPALFYKLQR